MKLCVITSRIHGRCRDRRIHVSPLKSGGYAEWLTDSESNVVMIRFMPKEAA